MWKKWILLPALMLLLGGLASAGAGIDSLEQLRAPGVTVGVSQGSAAERIVREQLPEAELMYFNDNPSAYLAVAQGKADAFVYDLSQMRVALAGGVEGVHLLDETLGEPIRIAVGVSPASKIPELKDRLNRFIAEIGSDGTLEDMRRRWVMDGSDAMPDIPLPSNPALRLVVGTSGIVPPYSYYVGTELSGYDIELARRFAAWLGADLQFKVYDYGAIIPACATGDVDCVMANLNITPERAEALPFSDVLYEEQLGVLVRGDAADAPAAGAYTSLSQLNGKRIGVQTGSSFDAMVAEKLPDARLEYFNGKADLVAALTGGKIDAFAVDEPVAQLLAREDDRVTWLPEYLDQYDFGFAFPKNEAGEALRDEFNAFLAPLRADGTLAAMAARWFGEDESAKAMPDVGAPEAGNGTLRLATESGYAPFEYVRDGRVVGYDMELAARFCEARGYGLEIVDMNYDAILSSLQAGKCDFAAAGISITPERAESVLFSEPNFSGGTVLAVRKDDAGAAAEEAPGVSWQDYNGRRIGVLTGPLMEDAAKACFPDSETLLFNSYPDCVTALLTGKIDGYLADGPSTKILHAEQPEVDYIHDYITRNNYSFAFRKDDPESAALCAELNDFLARSQADGTMRELDDIWFGADEARKVVDMSDLTGENGVIRVITTSTDMPFSYVKDGKNVGYDIDLTVRFCRDRGYALELVDVDFAGRIPALESGKGDFTTDMNVTPEREEQVLFSDPTSYGGIVLAVRSSDLAAADAGQPEFTSLDELNGRRAGVTTGSFHDAVIAAKLPDSPISQFNTYPDMTAALKSRKIDFFLASTDVASSLMKEDDAILALRQPVQTLDIAAMFAKTDRGEALKAQMDAFIEQLRADGTLSEIYAFWNDPAHESTPVDMSGLTGENGTLQFATSGTKVPVSFVANGQIAGTDPDIAVRFCREYGYDIEVNIVDTSGILPGITTGVYDFSLSDMAVTEERKESVLFSVPYRDSKLLVLTRRAGAAAAEGGAEEKKGFLESLKASFGKTFLREARWKLFADGVLTTLLITLLTILCGTALGFGVFMLCRNGNPVANLVTRFCLWLVQGMPMVVLLMILYYIIFGHVAISGMLVAVIGFTLTFGAAVFGLLKMGVGAVDRGQYEAACALGYSNRQTFFRIILPQALPHVLPAYKGEIVGLIKATAIVGYISVPDLTRMGDIVRSRTYEAFFPLIAVTVIYFVLEGLLGFLVSKIQIRMNPKKRKPESILKGVNIHD